jgi:hypothetical protein
MKLAIWLLTRIFFNPWGISGSVPPRDIIPSATPVFSGLTYSVMPKLTYTMRGYIRNSGWCRDHKTGSTEKSACALHLSESYAVILMYMRTVDSVALFASCGAVTYLCTCGLSIQLHCLRHVALLQHVLIKFNETIRPHKI